MTLTGLLTVLPSLTELIPEYGYHENFPVIFLREAGPGSYSVQSLAKEKAPKPGRKCSVSSSGSGSSGSPPAASLYYRFSNLDGTSSPLPPWTLNSLTDSG